MEFLIKRKKQVKARFNQLKAQFETRRGYTAGPRMAERVLGRVIEEMTFSADAESAKVFFVVLNRALDAETWLLEKVSEGDCVGAEE